ncbi:hypothetical protein [Macrococcoides caseolyticum]|uniref:hypothetical protein n=1 Tax=Macrococcoides caseolyticum TaxID=69966 RepID=UPI001F33E398|nr:hypothetical protein [Macrococcus caseolyticus]MCE4957464.1 hypothetical protein [Macrococcus caseolyticus]
MKKINMFINSLVVLLVLVALMHIPNNIFDWNIKLELRYIQLFLGALIIVFVIFKYSKQTKRKV